MISSDPTHPYSSFLLDKPRETGSVLSFLYQTTLTPKEKGASISVLATMPTPLVMEEILMTAEEEAEHQVEVLGSTLVYLLSLLLST